MSGRKRERERDRQKTFLFNPCQCIYTMENGILKIIAVTRGLLSFRTDALISVRNYTCTIKLKIREIVVIIKILKAIGQMFSLIVHGVADKNKCCGSYCENLFFQSVSLKIVGYLYMRILNICLVCV